MTEATCPLASAKRDEQGERSVVQWDLDDLDGDPDE